MTCVILIPVLRRPHRVLPLLESIENATPERHRVLFICTPGDTEEIEAVDKAGGERICTEYVFTTGDYARKINLGYRASWESLIFCGADDLLFHPGWLAAAKHELTDDVGVVGTNDLTNRRTQLGIHSTHSLVTREYADRGTIDRTRQILHEGYHHNWCDDELVQTARARDAYAHAGDSHVEHLHPMKRKAPNDAIYDHGQSGFEADRRLFNARRSLWT